MQLHLSPSVTLCYVSCLQSCRIMQLPCFRRKTHCLFLQRRWAILWQVMSCSLAEGHPVFLTCIYLRFFLNLFEKVMAHCSRRGDEMLVGDLSHMHVYEQGGSAQVNEVTWHPDFMAINSELFVHVFLFVWTAGWCPLHHLEHPAEWNIWSGWDGIKDPPRLPETSLHSLAPHMFGEHAQHSGRLCAAANVPAGGVWSGVWLVGICLF